MLVAGALHGPGGAVGRGAAATVVAAARPGVAEQGRSIIVFYILLLPPAS